MSRSGPIINWMRFGIKQQKPVNFPEVEEEGFRQFSISGDPTSERQKEWREEIQKGERQRDNRHNTKPVLLCL